MNKRSPLNHKTCILCGETFLPTSGNQRYCVTCKAEVFDKDSRRYDREAYLAKKRKGASKRLSRKLSDLSKQGLTYAEMQKAETVEKYARVEVPE